MGCWYNGITLRLHRRKRVRLPYGPPKIDDRKYLLKFIMKQTGNTATTKKCTACEVRKPLEQFYKDVSKVFGKGNECIDCTKSRQANWRKNPKNRERSRLRSKEWHANPENKAYRKTKYKENYNPEKKRNERLKINYGISLEEYKEIVNKLESKCQICGKVFKKLVIDHDHMTNKIRGLLCNLCNVGLGAFKDTIESLKMAIKYLRKYNK